MKKIHPVPLHRLHASSEKINFPWPTTHHMPERSKKGRDPFQKRAMEALDLALQINKKGYNIYLCGDPSLGRLSILLSYLKPVAAKKNIPDDLLYYRNFSNPDFPGLLTTPGGSGKKFCSLVSAFIENLKNEMEKLLNEDNFSSQFSLLQSRYHANRQILIEKMEKAAANKGFKLEIEENGGLILNPLDATPDSSSSYGNTQANSFENSNLRENLSKELSDLLRKLRSYETSLQEEEKKIHDSAMTQVMNNLMPHLEQKIFKICKSPAIISYLEDLKKDILKNASFFLPTDFSSADVIPHSPTTQNDFFKRYNLNLFVDNSAIKGAPIVIEDHPTVLNLFGCMERESDMGTLVPDFTLIRSGSLHRANGGYLIINIQDILRFPAAWDGLLRSLRTNSIKMSEDSEFPESPMRPKGLRPDPVALNLKIILIGDDDLYELLLEQEESFGKLFRIKAHLSEDVERTRQNVQAYLFQLAKIARDENLLPFDQGALAWLVNLGSHLCEDQRRLSLKFPVALEHMTEASALAMNSGKSQVDSQTLELAWNNRAKRENLLEDVCHDDYNRQLIKVKTKGNAVGEVNGLAVTWSGKYEFGLPHRISCAVGVGHDGIIDLEREAELGGPIHTKAVMILKSYLTNVFARKKPLVFTASIHFEQNYSEVEGDSASGAELIALLSALADIPVRLDLAFTGAVSHSGEILAVGGVTHKIEGFFRLCKSRGLTGSQGVIIPTDNIDHLMLSQEIIKSVEEGRFVIYPVRHIEEAVLLLTGLKAGTRRKDNSFTRGSLFDIIDRRLENLGAYAQCAFKRQRKEA